MGNTPSTPSKSPPSPSAPSESAEACPVDHKTRAAYLAASKSSPAPSSPSTSSNPHRPPSPQRNPHPLPEHRVTSSIPRALSSPHTTTPNPSSESHASTPQPAGSNWIYPSERMFFDAMTRKSYNPSAPDMATVVPIHNAVNERAWHEILSWEVRGSSRVKALNAGCGGPKLRSFKGDSGKLTPRARWRSLVGYEKPFDRHDWVVERCQGGEGGGVEYVIDFYAGKGAGGGKLNFFLDVRPKLNSWEGWRMRVGRFLGLE